MLAKAFSAKGHLLAWNATLPTQTYTCGECSVSKRIRNYRTGDRAEDLGIFLLKAFCAVAPIPRQEDFGLADAVATLLRSEGRFWYAEDSFLVQFKSRTEKNLTLKGPVF